MFAIADAVDAGDVVGQEAVPIGPEDTIAEVAERVTGAYLTLLERHLFDLLNGSARRTPQEHALATVAPRRSRDDDRIVWEESAGSICDLVRAVTAPYRGAFSSWRGCPLLVWSATPLEETGVGTPGLVLRSVPGQGVVVQTGQKVVLLRRVQQEGSLPRRADELLAAGEVLSAVVAAGAA